MCQLLRPYCEFHLRKRIGLRVVLLAIAVLSIQQVVTAEEATRKSSQSESKQREFSPYLDAKWIGQGISYGPYREEQAPHGASPSRDELTEDLYLLAKHWNLLRMYGTGAVTEQALQIIHEEKLPLRVMLGAWITRETESDTLHRSLAVAAKKANDAQVAEAIRLANSYPNEVVAVSVGNETRVFWSDHITEQDVLIRYIRQVRNATKVPVTTADDFNFWNKPESKEVAAEIDFIVTHIHAMWAGLQPATAMQWTEDIYGQVSKFHPNKTVVIGEAGWATQVHNEGEQSKLIKGEAGEAAQQLYYQQFSDWANQEKVCTFFFEAFDEPWKGGGHPNEVEKHWGVFNVDRTPKAVMKVAD